MPKHTQKHKKPAQQRKQPSRSRLSTRLASTGSDHQEGEQEATTSYDLLNYFDDEEDDVDPDFNGYSGGKPKPKASATTSVNVVVDDDDDRDSDEDCVEESDVVLAQPGTFICPKKCDGAVFPTDYSLLQHVLADHTKHGYVHDIPMDDVRKAGLDMCEICLTLSLKKNKHPCNCYKLGAVEDQFSKTRKAFNKCIATSSLSNFNFGNILVIDNYDWGTVCTRQFRLIPPLKRSETFGFAFEYITDVILDQIVNPPANSTEEQVTRAQMLLMLLPRLLLCYPAKYDPRERSLNNVLLGRINDFLDLQFDKLFQEAADSTVEFLEKHVMYANTVTAAASATSAAQVSNDALIKKHAKIHHEVTQGNISKAMTLLSSESHFKDPSDPEVKLQLRELFKPDCDQVLDPTTLATPLTKYLTPKDVEVAVTNSRKSSAGPSGWSFDLLKMVARRKTGKVLLAAFINRLLKKDFPPEMMQALCNGSLTVLSKPNSNGVRPIVVNDAFIRLLAKAIIIREQQYVGQQLAPIQAGVGLSGGIEFVIHTVRQLMHTHNKDWACISIDCKNAYGSILLKVIQEQLQQIKHGRADFISAYFDSFVMRRRVLKTPGSSDTIEVGDGIIQGDPLSPLYFCLAIHPVLVAVQELLSDGHVFGYLDDLVLVGPATSVFPAFDLFKTKAAQVGLHVNLTKTKVLSMFNHPESTTAELSIDVAADATPGHPDGSDGNNAQVMDTSLPTLTQMCHDHGLPSPVNCITLLGTPVGVPTEEAKEAIKYINNIPFGKLKELGDHQTRFALLRDTMSQTVNHLARTMPPSCVKPAFAIFDGKMLDVVRTCLEASKDEISAMTRKEIALPANNGGLGFPELKESCELAYFSCVYGVVQTWLLYKKADDPLLQSWAHDDDDFITPLPQRLSKLSLVKELKFCLNKAHQIATQAVQAKNARPDKASKTHADDPKAKAKPKPSRSKIAPDSATGATPTVIQNAFALSVLPATLPGMLVLQKKRSLQTILLRCKAAVEIHDFYTRFLTTNEERAQFNSKRGPGASAFLRALPSERGLTFENKYFMLALRLHLRLPIIPKFGIKAGIPCCCDRDTKEGKSRLTEDHLLNCHAYNGMNNRHEALKNVFVDLLKFCKLSPDFEDLAGPGTGKINRWDVSADRYNKDNQDLKVDVTVVNPVTRHQAPKSASRQGAAALKARNKKIAKYKAFLKPSDDFYPLAFETFGYIDTPVLGLISTLAGRVNNLPPETSTWTAPTFKSYAVQRLSCCLWKENARAVETVITNTAAEFEYEPYNSVSYEDRIFPQFEMSSADFPPLIPNEKKKVTFVTLVEKIAEKAPSTAVAANGQLPQSAAISSDVAADHLEINLKDLVDLTLDEDFADDDDDADDDLVPTTLVPSQMPSASPVPVGMTNPLPPDASITDATTTSAQETRSA